MYENEVNAAQFNTFNSSAGQTNVGRLEQLQDLTGNMKLRASLLLADAAQRITRPALRQGTNNAVNFRANGKYAEEFKKASTSIKETALQTKKLEEQSLKSLGLIQKDAKKTFLPFQKEIPKNLEDFGKTAKNAFEPTNTIIGKTRKTIAGFENTLEKLAGATFITKSLEILANGFAKVKDELDGVNSSLKVLNKTGIDSSLLASVKEFEDALLSLDFNNTEELATNFVAQYTNVTQSLAQVGTLIPEQLKKGAEAGRDVLGGIFDDLQNMVSGSLKNTVTTADAIAATYTALQAGIGGGDDVDEAVKGTVENTLKLVATQGGDANQIMELLVQTMTAFNMSANSSGEILGKLNELVNVGITSIPELANGFGQLGVGASRAGVTFDDLTSSMALLTLSGSNTFSAMTNLQNVFNKIASGSVTERLAEMGATLNGQAVRFDSASVSANGFIESVQMLNKALGGSQEKLQQAFGGDQEAIKGISGVLKQNADQIKTITDKIAQAGVKNLEEAFNIKIDNDKILQFEQVLNRVSEIALKLGKILAPLFSKGLDRIEKTIDRIEYLTKNYGGLIVKIVELNLALKALSGAFGALIGVIMQLAGAYAVYLLASGKLLKNGMAIFGMLTSQNKVLNQNNLLWNKNASIFQKILGVFGQLIGVYDLQSAGQTKISKAQEATIALEAKQRAVQAAAHKEKMAQLQQQINAQEQLMRVREGKTDNRNINVFNEQKLLDRDTEVLTKKQKQLNEEIYALAPESPERAEKVKEVRKVNERIVETEAIKEQNRKKIARFEQLSVVDDTGESAIQRMRRSAQELQQRDPNTLTRDERKTLNSYNKQIKFYDEVEIGRRAKDWNADDEFAYRQNVATKKYIDENQDKPAFQRRVERAERADAKEKGVKTKQERIVEAFERKDAYGTNVKTDKQLEVEMAREKMRTLQKDSNEYRRQQRIASRAQKSLDIYDDAKNKVNLRGTNFSGGKGFENSFTSGIAGLIDDVTSFPAALQDVGKQVGEVTKNMKKNLVDMVQGLGKFGKSMLTFNNILRTASLGLVGLAATIFVVAEKQAQQAREMLKEAGLNEKDPDIISPLDALKKQLVDIGKWITDFVSVTYNEFKKGLQMIASGIMYLPKLIIKGLFLIENGWNNFMNNILNTGVGKILFGGQQIDTEAVKQRQEADLAKLDQMGKDIVDKFTKPLDDAGNAFTRFVNDVTYAVTEANKDIARAKLRERKAENSFTMAQIERKLGSLNTVGIGGKFDNVIDENGKKQNLSDSLKEKLTKDVVTQNDLQEFGDVSSRTLSALTNQYKEFERQAKANETIDNVQRKDLLENIKLDDKQDKSVLESYINAKIENDKVNMGRKEEDKVELKLTDAEQKVATSLNQTQRDQVDAYIKTAVQTSVENDKANTFNKNLNDLTGVLGTVQNLLKNRSDIGGSNNVDATVANKGLESLAKNLGDNVSVFAQSLSVLQNSKFSQEELVKLAQESPEKYKKLLEDSGADFKAATNVFTEVQKNIPMLVEKIAQNAEMGYLSEEDQERGLTADTSKAQRFQETITKTFNQQFIDQGYSAEDAQKFTDALLADQKMREQIFALEKDDSDKRIQRFEREKQIFETLKQSELLVTKDVIQKTQEFEEKSLQESIAFQKKRIETLQKSSDGLDAQVIKDAQTDLMNLEKQQFIQRMNNQKELFDYESNLLEKKINLYRVSRESELLVTKEIITKIQKLEQESLQKSIAFQKQRIKTLKENNSDSEVVEKAEVDLQILEEKQIVQRIEQKRELLEHESKMIMDIYDKRYAEIEEKSLRNESNFTSADRIKLEAEKQRELLKLNVQTQLKLREILQKEGKYNKETQSRIDKEIAQTRVELLKNYIQEATDLYDNLTNRITRFGDIEATQLSMSIGKLEQKLNVYGQISQIIEQQKELANSAQSDLDRDADFIRSNLLSRRKQIDFEKKYAEERKKALRETIALERQTLAIQKEQNKLLIQKLKIEQEANEKRAVTELKVAMLNESKVATTSTSATEKYAAKAEREIAELNLKAVVMNRENIRAQEVVMKNDSTIKEYNLRRNEKQSYQDLEREAVGRTLNRRDDARLTRKTLREFGYEKNATPVLENFIPNSGVNIDGFIAQIQQEVSSLSAPITEQLEVNRKGLDDALKVQTENGKTLTDFKDSFLKYQENLLKDQKTLIEKQDKVVESIDATNTIQQTIAEKTDKDLGLQEKILNELMNLRPKNETDKPETSQTPKVTVEENIQKVKETMLRLSGVNPADVPKEKLPNIVFSDEPKGGGDYNFNTNELRLKKGKGYEEDIKNLSGQGMRILVHELRHWMQDEGYNNGWLNTNQIKDPETRKWAKETGLAFSGDNKYEQDAYTYDAEYTDEIINKIVSKTIAQSAESKEAANERIEQELTKQTSLQETIVKLIETLYGASTTTSNGANNNAQKIDAKNVKVTYPKKQNVQVGQKVDIVSVNKEGKEIGKTSNVRVISKERANEIQAQKDLGDKVRAQNNEYYQTLAQLGGYVDVRPNAKPEEQVAQLKKMVADQVKLAYKLHTEGKMGAEQTQDYVKDWKQREKDYITILQRGVKNPTQEVAKLKKQQEENRAKQVEKETQQGKVRKSAIQTLPIKEVVKTQQTEYVQKQTQIVAQQNKEVLNTTIKTQPLISLDNPIYKRQDASVGGGWNTDGRGGYITAEGNRVKLRSITNQELLQSNTYKQLQENKLNSEFLQNLNPQIGVKQPSFKYQGERDKILASLNTNTALAEKMNTADKKSTNNNKQENKNVTVTLSPRIEIKIEKDGDVDLAKMIAEKTNKQLFDIWNEVSYKI